MTAIEHLTRIASDSICPTAPASRVSLPDSLALLLTAKNGLFAFEGALLVLPTEGDGRIPGLFQWNDNDGWRRHYPRLPGEILFFAMDAFACQFGVSTSGAIYRLESETGDLTLHSAGLAEWAEKVMLNYDFETGWSVAKEWQEHWGPLESGERLLGKHPFVLGGDYVVENLVALPCADAMKKLGRLAEQVAAVPEGSTVTIKDWL